MEHLIAAARYADIELNQHQLAQMETYARWLGSEGVRAGGIGPGELNRLELRHLADSLLFAVGMNDPKEVWDLGTGVGLPGVPLAIAMPETDFFLVDRSGRRIDLLRRVIRILDLANCQTLHGEIEDVEGPLETIVARASLSPSEMLITARRLVGPGGTVTMGGSWRERPQHQGWETIEIPRDVLDQTVWLLIMRRQ